jgi:hypothetical protein
LLDHDGDRHPTWAEYVAGTDPGDSNSVLRASIGTTTAADAWVLAWPAADGRQYDIQTSTNPVSGFQPLAPGLMGTPPQNRFTNPIVDSGTTTFLRLHVRIAP